MAYGYQTMKSIVSTIKHYIYSKYIPFSDIIRAGGAYTCGLAHKLRDKRLAAYFFIVYSFVYSFTYAYT